VANPWGDDGVSLMLKRAATAVSPPLLHFKILQSLSYTIQGTPTKVLSSNSQRYNSKFSLEKLWEKD
jgi:hypothetical protein